MLRKRTQDLRQLNTTLAELRLAKARAEEEVTAIRSENLGLAAKVSDFLSAAPALTVLCEASEQFMAVSAQLRASEGRCKTLEEVIQKHAK